MPAPPAYERDPYLKQIETAIVESSFDGKRPFAVLEDTVLYPEGGGQPADHGEINGVRVLDVQKRRGQTLHFVERPLPIGPASVSLDWTRRFDHMQQHTGQHLLTAVAQDRFGWSTTAFHLGETLSDIELGTGSLSLAKLDELEEAVATEIRAARSVSVRLVEPEALPGLPVRTRGLPEGHEGPVRLVEIAGVDLNTCGGTHLGSSAEIELVKLLHTEAIRGGTRLFFVAGGRARRRFSENERRNAELRVLLGTADADLPRAAGFRIEENKHLGRTLRALEEELIEQWLAVAGAQSERIRHVPFKEKTADFLQRLGRAFSGQFPGRAFLLTSTLGEQHFFVLAFGEALSGDFLGISRAIATRLEGRGGGSGRIFQGKAGKLEQVSDCVELLEAALGRT